MFSRNAFGAVPAIVVLTLLAAAQAADPPASPADLKEELRTLRDRKSTLQTQIQHYQKDQVEATALSRARMGLAVVLAQEAILILRLDENKTSTFDDASELIRQAEAHTVSVDTSSLSADDQRVYSDLQAVCRRAVAAQVAYLHGRLKESSSPQVIYVPVPQQPAYDPPAYNPPPGFVFVPPPTTCATRPRRLLFRRPFFR